jgi:hypothetical protein
VGGQIEVKNAATIMGQDQKHVKDVETDVGDSEEIDRPYLPTGGKIFLLNSMTKELARATGLEPAASCETGQSSDLAYLGGAGPHVVRTTLGSQIHWSKRTNSLTRQSNKLIINQLLRPVRSLGL